MTNMLEYNDKEKESTSVSIHLNNHAHIALLTHPNIAPIYRYLLKISRRKATTMLQISLKKDRLQAIRTEEASC